MNISDYVILQWRVRQGMFDFISISSSTVGKINKNVMTARHLKVLERAFRGDIIQ